MGRPTYRCSLPGLAEFTVAPLRRFRLSSLLRIVVSYRGQAASENSALL